MTKQTEILHDYDDQGRAVFIVQCFLDRYADEPEIERTFTYYDEAKRFARDYLYGRTEEAA